MHPKGQEQQQSSKKDCLSCRVSGGIVQLGLAAYVASHYKEMSSKSTRISTIAFSAGSYPFYLICVPSLGGPSLGGPSLYGPSLGGPWPRFAEYNI
jgi:hypothetical protein